ncbi:hypothetical protein EVAR_3390_1 [Eumeta japonica]|uniref:Uncharacterized protein n=1 Tax=Eumeta variegata TaxID=151549 RepID=A0A4C1SSY2_EUMVA|nr:hypothetical protein EVAR_3390_1 [Eumeta japonica]
MYMDGNRTEGKVGAAKQNGEKKRRSCDEFRDGRPFTSMTNKNIDTVRCMIESDRHMTHHEIWASLGRHEVRKNSLPNLLVIKMGLSMEKLSICFVLYREDHNNPSVPDIAALVTTVA